MKSLANYINESLELETKKSKDVSENSNAENQETEKIVSEKVNNQETEEN